MNPEPRLVSVLAASSEGQRLLAESILRDAGIEFVLKNYAAQHFIGLGQVGGGNLIIGPVELLVAETDQETARALLSESDLGIRDPLSEAAEASRHPIAVTESEEERYYRYSRYSMVWGVLWLGGVGSLLALNFGVKALGIRSGFDDDSMPPAAKPWIGIVLGSTGIVYWLLAWASLV